MIGNSDKLDLVGERDLCDSKPPLKKKKANLAHRLLVYEPLSHTRSFYDRDINVPLQRRGSERLFKRG